MMKTIQDNDVTNHADVVYAKNDIELSWPIRSGADCDENQLRQLRDLLYRHGLYRKRNWDA